VKRAILPTILVLLSAAAPSAALLPASVPALSAEFSYYAAGERVWGKANVTADHLRLEVQQGRVVWLVDLVNSERVQLLEGRLVDRRPMSPDDMRERALVGGPLQDLKSPCAETLDWFGDLPKAVERATIKVQSCKRLERVRLNDRDTEKWAMTINGDGQPSTRFLFVDPVLRRTIRIESAELENGRPIVFQELRNIAVGPQPDGLFEIPSAATEP